MIRFLDYTKLNESGDTVVEKLPIRVSYYALKMLKEKLGRGLLLGDDGTDYDAYEELLFWSLRRGYQLINQPMPFERTDMAEVMDAVYFQFMKVIPEFFSDGEEEEDKTKKGKGEVVEKKRKP